MRSLKFENISFGYNKGEPLFEGACFSFENPSIDNGHVIALMGQSGSGKSSLLNLILKNILPETGKIISYPDTPVISYVPQEPILFEQLSPYENARYLSTVSFYKKHFNEDLFQHLIFALNMKDVLAKRKSVNDLSGGQKQRLMLLRALSVNPDYLLLDEPTTGLDADIKLEFLSQLRKIVITQKILTIYVTHNKTEAEFISDEVAFISSNSLGTGNSIFVKPLREFIEAPPTLDAVKIFSYPAANLIRCRIHDNMIQLENTSESFDYYLAVKDQNIFFSKEVGYPFAIVSENSLYTTIDIFGQHLVIVAGAMNFGQFPFIYFGRSLNAYTKDGLFFKSMELPKPIESK